MVKAYPLPEYHSSPGTNHHSYGECALCSRSLPAAAFPVTPAPHIPPRVSLLRPVADDVASAALAKALPVAVLPRHWLRVFLSTAAGG